MTNPCPGIRFRYVVVLLCSMAAFFEFSTRNNINNAIVSMVSHEAFRDAIHDRQVTDFCRKPPVNRTQVLLTQERLSDIRTFDWTPTTQGLILGSFFYGYVVLQVPSGRMAEVLGGKWIVAVAIVGSSLVNVVTPFIAQSVPLLTTSRVILGLLQGGVYPACFSLIVNWMPPDQRSLGFGLVNVGGNLGSVFASAITGFLAQTYGWPYSFFVTGTIAMTWVLLCWMPLIRSHPDKTEIEETTNILSSKAKKGSPSSSRSSSSPNLDIVRPLSVPWVAILTNRAVLSAAFCRFVGTFGYLTLQTKLPAYLEDILHESVAQNGLSNGFLFLATAMTMALGPFLSEMVISRHWLSRSTTRKVFSGMAQYGLVLCLMMVPWMGCSSNKTTSLLVLGMFLYGLITGGDVIVPAEVSTNFPATIYAAINMFSSFAGVISPLLVGWILEGAQNGVDLKSRWDQVFYLTSAIVTIGTTTFIVFGSSKRQDFDFISTSVDSDKREVG